MDGYSAKEKHMPDDAQPAEGQGSEATGSPYDSYLQSVPNEAREAAEQWFRDTSKGLDAKLQEAAEFQKEWEPFQQVQEYLAPFKENPQQLAELVAWQQQVTSSDEAYKQWLENAAKEAGITPAEEAALEDAEVQGELTREEVQQLIQQTAEERMAPLQEQFQALEAERMVDTEAQSIEQAFAQIQAESKLELSKDQKAVILDLGMPLAIDGKGNELPMGDASWVAKGFDRWKAITAEGAKAFVEDKASQPGPAMTTGGAAALKPITSMEEARAALRERLRQQS
jgi:hypothetical protein